MVDYWISPAAVKKEFEASRGIFVTALGLIYRSVAALTLYDGENGTHLFHTFFNCTILALVVCIAILFA